MTAAAATAPAPRPARLAAKPRLVLGGERADGEMPQPLVAAADTLFAPRGALWHPDGSFWVCDTGHHRVLGWASLPSAGQAADWVIGQKDLQAEGPNGDCPAPCQLRVPTGLCALGDGLAVADAWNHRVLVWNRCPRASNAPADAVLGQADWQGREANRSNDRPAANTLHWPFGLLADARYLWVADTGNRRVLGFRRQAQGIASEAERVLGQQDFTCRDENAGGTSLSGSMRWPHGLCRWNEHLCVADAGNNRILVYSGDEPDTPAWILGQADETRLMHNRGRMQADADSLYMPYAVAACDDWLWAADTANSRLVGWHREDLATGAAATGLFGQQRWSDSGDNRWVAPADDSLSWPYHIGLRRESGKIWAVISDTGNSRIIVTEVVT